MLTAIAIVVLVAAMAIIATRTTVQIIIVKDSDMSAALDRLTASVDAAVAKISTIPASDDAALNALADKLDAAVNRPSGDSSQSGTSVQSLNG